MQQKFFSTIWFDFCFVVICLGTFQAHSFAQDTTSDGKDSYERQELVPGGDEGIDSSQLIDKQDRPNVSEPLDDADEDASVSKPREVEVAPQIEEKPKLTFVPSQLKTYSALYRTQLDLYFAKLANNGGHPSLQKIWYLGADFVGWMYPWLGWEGSLEWVPKVSSNPDSGIKSYSRVSLETGPRIGTLGSDRFRFYFSPLLQLSTLKVQSFVGKTTLNNPVFSEFGGSFKVFPGGALGANLLMSVLDLDLGVSYFLRKSNDGVQQSMFSGYAKAKFPIDVGIKSIQPNLFLFSRYEKYGWNETYSQGSSRNLDTEWTLVGLGLGVYF